jgi:FMN phosphatase YigB (HAD superfamily)
MPMNDLRNKVTYNKSDLNYVFIKSWQNYIFVFLKQAKMIKNIIFDFGNVLLNINESASYKALETLLDPAKCADINEMVFFPFEKGEISEEAFFNRLQRRSTKVYQAEVYHQAWNAMFLDFPTIREKMLLNLKNKYRIFLLSNTNITHIRFVRKLLERENNIFDFEHTFFEKAYYSFEMGMRKPDLEIFELVLKDSGLIASKSLFIDDKIENVEAAKALGLKTFHHNPIQDISEIIYDLLD